MYLKISSITKYIYGFIFNCPKLNDNVLERTSFKTLITIANFVHSKQTIYNKLEAK